TIADAADPRPLPVRSVDEPSLAVTLGINTSPLAGTEGDKVSASALIGRLEQELVGNVALRVRPTARPEVWEVQGRGELQLAVLVEIMRREGFELTVGKPEVLTREIDGKKHEPVERVAIDVPEEYIGVVRQLLALRKGALQERGSLFVAPREELYEGMVVGENARAEDLDVNASKEKKLTNMRSATADELVRLIPPRPLSLEQALEFIADDECVEVTPKS